MSDPTNQWNIFFGQSRNASRGDTCKRGPNCKIFGGNRDLADFITVTVDADGNANAVWTDDASQSPKAIVFAKQIGGLTTGKLPPKS